MPLNLPHPITYPITSGTTTPQTTPDVLRFLQAVVTAQIPLFQIREKSLPARVLYDLTIRAVEITRGRSGWCASDVAIFAGECGAKYLRGGVFDWCFDSLARRSTCGAGCWR